MNHFLELTLSTATAEVRKLRLSIDSIESYSTAVNMRDPHETVIVTKSGVVHKVDESVASIDAALNKIARLVDL